jgi:predicted short-subunit dehydrogenase-like oxidoreductase (DUF2520 family)
MDSPTYGLIGRGRLARHLAHYLALEGCAVTTWHRGMDTEPATTLAGSDVVLLAISDDAISGFVSQHPELGERTLVHFSGSLVVPGVVGLHPLMTFGPELYDLETYRAIPFIGDRGGVGFPDVFPTLGNPHGEIDPADRPLYHALCVLAGNFTTLLWTKAMADFRFKLGLPAETLRPFLERTGINTLDTGPAALTGSLARGDRGTIARDLSALDGDAYADVYRAFLRVVEASGATP